MMRYEDIVKEDPALSLRVALAGSEVERRAEFAEALDTWLSSKSFQGPEAVVRALGYNGLGTTQAQIERDVDTEWTGRLQDWTEMRHGLVHRAKKPFVNRASAAECVQHVENLVRTIDAMVFASR